MSVIRRAVAGGMVGLLVGAVSGPTIGIVSFLAFDVYLALTIDNPSPESLGPLYGVTVGGVMGLVVGIPTSVIVGTVMGIYSGSGGVEVRTISVGVFAGMLMCAAALVIGWFFPPLGNASLIWGGSFTVGAGAIGGIATGICVGRWTWPYRIRRSSRRSKATKYS